MSLSYFADYVAFFFVFVVLLTIFFLSFFPLVSENFKHYTASAATVSFSTLHIRVAHKVEQHGNLEVKCGGPGVQLILAIVAEV